MGNGQHNPPKVECGVLQAAYNGYRTRRFWTIWERLYSLSGNTHCLQVCLECCDVERIIRHVKEEEKLIKWHPGIEGPRRTAASATLLSTLFTARERGGAAAARARTPSALRSSREKGDLAVRVPGARSYANRWNKRRWKALLKLLLEGRYLTFCLVEPWLPRAARWSERSEQGGWKGSFFTAVGENL